MQSLAEKNQPTLLSSLLDDKRIALLKLLVYQPAKQWYLQEIAEKANVPMASTLRILNQFVDLNIVSIVKISRFKLYQLTDHLEIRQELLALMALLPRDYTLLDLMIDDLKQVKGVDKIILHGEANDSKASVILIGAHIDAEQVKHYAADAKQKHGFMLLPLIMVQEQYDYMRNANMISGEIKEVYVKK